MNIPTPTEIKNQKPEIQTKREQEYVDRIIDEFITAVKHNDWHFMSTEKEKEVFYPAEADYCKEYAFKKAEALLRLKGWDVTHAKKTCARGWYNAIVLNVP